MFEMLTSLYPDPSSVPIPVWLDAAAVMVGAIAGVNVAWNRKLDLIGHVAFAMIVGLGGGLIRDIIMQRGDVYMLNSPYAIIIVLLVGNFGFLFPHVLTKHKNVMEWVDVISMGLFAAAGTDKAIVYGLSILPCLLMGIITAIGGGMIRDICLGEVPRIFRKSNYYAICAVSGALTYLVCDLVLNWGRPGAAALCVLITLVLRRISLRYNLLSPAEVDFTPQAKHAARSVAHAAKNGSIRSYRKISHGIKKIPHHRSNSSHSK